MFESVKTFLTELHSLNNNLQKHSQAISKANEAAKEHKSETPEVRAILNFPESIQRSKEAADTREERYQEKNLLIGMATLISLIIYAITTIFIYCATDKAANAAKVSADAAKEAADEARRTRIQGENTFNATIAQFHMDQRAWMGVVAVIPSKLEVGSKFDITVLAKNTGKTPALKAIMTAAVEPLTPNMHPDYKPRVNAKLSRAIVTAGDGMFITVSPTPSNGVQKEAYDAFIAAKVIMYVHGHIAYADIFRCKHWVDFCYVIRPNGNAEICPEHNEIDTDECTK